MWTWLLPLVLGATPVKANEAVKTSSPAAQILKRDLVNDRLANLPSVLMEARLEERPPHGFEFQDIDKGSIYDVLGFRDGDILMEINGQKVKSSLQAAQLIYALKTESRFQVKIKRGAKVSQLAYRIED